MPLAENEKPMLLLYVCCGVCSTTAIERLREDYRVTAYFYGPNIHPEAEYRKRADTARAYAESVEVQFIEGDYNPTEWDELTDELADEPEGGARCPVCFGLRIDAAARRAAADGFDVFAATLSLSPHKDAELIDSIGREAGEKHGVKYLPTNFKKKDGFRRAGELASEANLYRQNYCGCRYSIRED